MGQKRTKRVNHGTEKSISEKMCYLCCFDDLRNKCPISLFKFQIVYFLSFRILLNYQDNV
jgi:hypothetical protein